MSTLTVTISNCHPTDSLTVYRSSTGGQWVSTGTVLGPRTSRSITVLGHDEIGLFEGGQIVSGIYTVPPFQKLIPSVVYFPFVLRNGVYTGAAPKEGGCSVTTTKVHIRNATNHNWEPVQRGLSINGTTYEPWVSLGTQQVLAPGESMQALVYNGFQVSMLHNPSDLPAPNYRYTPVLVPSNSTTPMTLIYKPNGVIENTNSEKVVIPTFNCYPIPFTVIQQTTPGSGLITTIPIYRGNPNSKILVAGPPGSTGVDPTYEVGTTVRLYNSNLQIASSTVLIDPNNIPETLTFNSDGNVGIDSQSLCLTTLPVTLHNCNRSSFNVQQRLDNNSPWLWVLDPNTSTPTQAVIPARTSRTLQILNGFSVRLINASSTSAIANPNSSLDFTKTIYFSGNSAASNSGCSVSPLLWNCFTSSMNVRWRTNSSSSWIVVKNDSNPSTDLTIPPNSRLAVTLPIDSQVQLFNSTANSGIAELSKLDTTKTIYFPTNGAPNNFSCLYVPPPPPPPPPPPATESFWSTWWWLFLILGIIVVIVIIVGIIFGMRNY